MSTYTMTGKIYRLFEVAQITDKFRKQEFVLEQMTSNSKGTYVEYVKFQAIQDRCNLLDTVEVGDNVNIEFSITGRKFKSTEGDKFFNNLDMMKITVLNKAELYISEDTKVDDVLPMGEKTSNDDDNPFDALKGKSTYEDDLPF